MSELADFYVTLRAISAPAIASYNEVAEAGERMAAKVITANERIIASNRQLEESMARLATATGTSGTAVADKAATMATSTGTAAKTMVDAHEEVIASQAAMRASTDKTAEQLYVQYPAMAAKIQKSMTEIEAAEARAAAANEKLGAAMAGAAATGEKTAIKWGTIQKVALGVGAAALIGAGATIHMAADFETATNTLVTSAGEAHDQIDMVRKGILDLASQVGYSTEDLAKAMYTVESGGQHGADGLKVLEAAAQGAKAENAELKTVADAVTSVLQDYHLKAADAANVTSKLVAATSVGKTTFEELSGSLSAILPIASSAHVSLDDILGSLASMTVHGMSAQQAAQNMADAVRHMTAPTQVQAKELGQLGLSAQDLAGILSEKGLSGTVSFLSETILKHMGPSGKVMLDSFNQSKDAAGAVKTMVASMPPAVQNLAKAYMSGSMSLADWTKAVKALPTDQAQLAKQFQTLEDRSRGFSDQLKSGSPAAQSYQDALRRVMGDATGLNVALMLTGENTDYVTEAVKTVAGATADASGNVKGWTDVQSTFNQKLASAKGAGEALAISIGQKLLPVASKIMDVFAKGAAWIAHNQAASITLASILGGMLVIGLAAATVAVWNFTAALLANPATWIVVGIMALIAAVVLLATHWSSVWNAIKSAAGAVWDFLKSYVFEPIKIAIGAIGDVISTLGRVWGAVWDGIGHAIQWVWDHTIGWIIGKIQDGIGIVKSFLSALGIGEGEGKLSGGVHTVAQQLNTKLAQGTGGHQFATFDDGGWVPGPKGAPQLIIAHGGEYVLSDDMLAGRAHPDPRAGKSLLAPPAAGLPGVSDSGSRGTRPGGLSMVQVIPASSTGGNQPTQVINQYVLNIAGQVVTWRQLVTDLQEALLRHNGRNMGNGASLVTT